MISLPARSSVVMSICLILTFLVAAVLIVVLFCFVSTPGFLSYWTESPNGQHEFRRLCFWQHFWVMLKAPVGPYPPVLLQLSMSKQYSSCPSEMSLCQAVGGAVGFKTTTMSAHLNFAVENPTCIFEENNLQGWKYHPVSVAVLIPHPCPMGRCSAVCQLCSGLGVGFQLCPSPWPPCLALSLLEIYSRNRKHETHLNSKGGE